MHEAFSEKNETFVAFLEKIILDVDSLQTNSRQIYYEQELKNSNEIQARTLQLTPWAAYSIPPKNLVTLEQRFKEEWNGDEHFLDPSYNLFYRRSATQIYEEYVDVYQI